MCDKIVIRDELECLRGVLSDCDLSVEEAKDRVRKYVECKEREIKDGDIVRHFKGKLYRVICIAEHTEEGTDLVVYQALYSPYKTYARPREMFMSKVDKVKYPEVEQEYRFERYKVEEGV